MNEACCVIGCAFLLVWSAGCYKTSKGDEGDSGLTESDTATRTEGSVEPPPDSETNIPTITGVSLSTENETAASTASDSVQSVETETAIEADTEMARCLEWYVDVSDCMDPEDCADGFWVHGLVS